MSVRQLLLAFFQRYCTKNGIPLQENPIIHLSKKLNLSFGMTEKFFSESYSSLKIETVASLATLLDLTVDERTVLYFALFEKELPVRVQKLIPQMPIYTPIEETRQQITKCKTGPKGSKLIHASGTDWDVLKKVSEVCQLTTESKTVLNEFISTKGEVRIATLLDATNANSARSIFTYMEVVNRELQRVMEKTIIDTGEIILFKIIGDTQAQTTGFTLKKKILL